MKFLAIACLTILATLATVSLAEEETSYIGLHRLYGNTRLTNGQNAVRGSFPYQVSIQWGWRPFIDFTHACGGSIISRRWVVTAAHCFTDLPTYGSFEVFAGKHSINSFEITQQSRTIERYIIHPSYFGGVNPHDIALVRLSRALIFTAFIGSISLPLSNVVHSGNVVLTGWGSTSLTTVPINPTVLQTVTVPIVPTDVCFNVLDGIISGTPALDSSKLDNVCTGPIDDSRISACSGDSGGPLAQRVGGKWELVGIVSWGIFPCGVSTAPSVYVRVSAYVTWINENLAAND